ncbi:hypothetical protein [Aerosakkonema funiforme]|uniref:hypothetical protein n=1 Tax=Aerosakkonema funiforme TaxID=1246630 RepID=UPI001F553C46|nr:hypothetical protein [Aerosakkonema funiforme]
MEINIQAVSPKSIAGCAVAAPEASWLEASGVGTTGNGATSAGEAVGDGDISLVGLGLAASVGETVGDGDASGEPVGDGDASGEPVGDGDASGEPVGDGDASGLDSVGEGLAKGDASWANVFSTINPKNRHTEIKQAMRNFFNTCLFPSISKSWQK